MDLRRLARGSLDWTAVEGIAAELARRLGRPSIRVSFIEAQNWSSIPFTVDDEYFVKVVTPQHALVHAILTGARNLGALTSGSPGFFERFDGPLEMAEHELEAVRAIRALGINAPAPVEAFAHGDYGVVVMEYLPSFRPLDEVDLRAEPELVDDLFRSLATMHAGGVVHGDLRADNVLVDGGGLHFIDATLVREEWADDARGYDLACAIALVCPQVGPRVAVDVARRHFSVEDLLDARRFLDFVRVRPDHDFDVVQVRGEIEGRVA
ncbi:MAG: RIO1 family regulatory kinase/ATPase [Halobacteriales archaeon]